jgi:hypothetical protein
MSPVTVTVQAHAAVPLLMAVVPVSGTDRYDAPELCAVHLELAGGWLIAAARSAVGVAAARLRVPGLDSQVRAACAVTAEDADEIGSHLEFAAGEVTFGFAAGQLTLTGTEGWPTRPPGPEDGEWRRQLASAVSGGGSSPAAWLSAGSLSALCGLITGDDTVKAPRHPVLAAFTRGRDGERLLVATSGTWFIAALRQADPARPVPGDDDCPPWADVCRDTPAP